MRGVSFAGTGTGPRISATWKSRTKVCLNHDRRRPMNVGNAGATPSSKISEVSGDLLGIRCPPVLGAAY